MRKLSASGRHNYFEGWYFKQQSKSGTLAFIPSLHADGEGRFSASVQVITDTASYHTEFPSGAFAPGAGQLLLRVGDSVFTRSGCTLELQSDNLSLSGHLSFGSFSTPAGDIMGPFRYVPFLECRHSVLSMRHSVNGSVAVNGVLMEFDGGIGYLEGDRGTSFPRRYLWTQCLHEESSIMLSVAEIPLYGITFTGCVGFVFTGGREYRVATYRGVKLLQISDRTLVLRQGALTIRAEFLGGRFHPLRAPRQGIMARTIHESASCRVHFTCTLRNNVLLDFISEQASFETNWDSLGGAPESQTNR